MGIRKIENNLLPVRRKRGLSRKQVASLLGYKSISTIARIEQGKLIPPLGILLRLEILYRTPVAFLYTQFYVTLREELRAKEEALAGVRPGAERSAEEGGCYA